MLSREPLVRSARVVTVDDRSALLELSDAETMRSFVRFDGVCLPIHDSGTARQGTPSIAHQSMRHWWSRVSVAELHSQCNDNNLAPKPR